MNKKIISLIAMIVSAAIAVCGILVLTGSLGGDTSYPGSSTLYDSGYSKFGADFYTYVSNNAAEAASAARTTANNIGDIADLLKNVCGLSMLGIGLLCLCHFSMIWITEKNNAIVLPTPAQTEEAPAEDTDEAEEAEEVTEI